VNLSDERICGWCLLCQVGSDEYAGPDRWDELEYWLTAHGQSLHDPLFPHYITTRETWRHLPEDLLIDHRSNEADYIDDELFDEIAFADSWGFGVPLNTRVRVNSCPYACHSPGEGTLLAFHRVTSARQGGNDSAGVKAIIWRGAGEQTDSVERDHLTPLD